MNVLKNNPRQRRNIRPQFLSSSQTTFVFNGDSRSNSRNTSVRNTPKQTPKQTPTKDKQTNGNANRHGQTTLDSFRRNLYEGSELSSTP